MNQDVYKYFFQLEKHTVLMFAVFSWIKMLFFTNAFIKWQLNMVEIGK